MHIAPFHIAIPEADLADLQARLARTRLAPAIAGQGSSEGMIPLSWRSCWRTGATASTGARSKHG